MEAVMRRTEASGTAAVAVTTTPRAWPRNKELSAKFANIVPALGLHPQLVGSGPSETHVWDLHLAEAKFVGEVGLDAGPRFYKNFQEQKRVFGHVLKACSQNGGKVLTTDYAGHPASLPLIRDMLRAYAATHGLRVHDRGYEEYLTEISETAAEDSTFKVYWPIL